MSSKIYLNKLKFGLSEYKDVLNVKISNFIMNDMMHSKY